MSDAHSPAFTQDFEVEILTNDDMPSVIATALSKAIVGWEREYNEEDEDDTADGFLVSGAEDQTEEVDGEEEGEDDGEGDDEDDEESDDDIDTDEEAAVVEEPSDSVLNIKTTVNAKVLEEIKALQAMDADDRIIVRLIYSNGVDQAKLVRQFSVSPDVGILMPGTDKTTDLLELTLVADIYDAEIIF